MPIDYHAGIFSQITRSNTETLSRNTEFDEAGKVSDAMEHMGSCVGMRHRCARQCLTQYLCKIPSPTRSALHHSWMPFCCCADTQDQADWHSANRLAIHANCKRRLIASTPREAGQAHVSCVRSAPQNAASAEVNALVNVLLSNLSLLLFLSSKPPQTPRQR